MFVKRIIVGAIFAVSCFLGITLFRGIALGFGYAPRNMLAALAIAAITGAWLYWAEREKDEGSE